MTFGQFLSILRARWWAALLVLSLALGIAIAFNLLLPKQYKALASVLVDSKPDPVSVAMFGGQSPGFMATQVDIIESDRVAQRVVRNLKLVENPQIRKQWQDESKGEGSIESWLGNVFQKNMEVIPSRESSVIVVSYKAPDPRFAAALANAFVQAYVDTALDLRVDPARQYSTFFESRSKEAREALELAQSKLSSFQREKGIIANDERLDIENSRLNELSSQLTALQAMSAEAGSRQTQAMGSSGDRMQEVLNNGLVSGLRADLSRSEARLQELSTRFGDNHPQVQELKANIAEMRSRLDAEVRKVTSGVGLTNTITKKRESEVRASLEAQRSKVLRLKAVRDEGMVMMRDVENAQRSYDAVQQRLTQTSLESQTKQSNEAVPPLTPASPHTTLNILLGLVGGTLLAVATVLLLEIRDRRVRNTEDLTAVLNLPVLASLPRPVSRLKLGNKQSPMQQRLMAPLQTTSKGA
jgi:polysaccharide biosynthesis transport protein